jgi:hypothetical protein
MIDSEIVHYNEMKRKADVFSVNFLNYYKQKLDSMFFLDSKMSKDNVIDDFSKYISKDFTLAMIELEKSEFLTDKNDLRSSIRSVIRKVDARFNAFKSSLEQKDHIHSKECLRDAINDISLCILSLKTLVDDRIKCYYRAIDYFKEKNIICKVYFLDPQKHDYEIDFNNDEGDPVFRSISMFIHSECYRFIKKEISEKFLKYADKFKNESELLFSSISSISCISYFQKLDNIKLRQQTILENKDMINLFIDQKTRDLVSNLELFESALLMNISKIKDFCASVFTRLNAKGKFGMSQDAMVMISIANLLEKTVAEAVSFKPDDLSVFMSNNMRDLISKVNYKQQIDTDSITNNWILPVKVAHLLFPTKVNIFWESLKVNKLLDNFNCTKIDDDVDFGLTGVTKKEEKNLYKEAYHWYAIGMPQKKEHYKKIILQKMCMIEYSSEIVVSKDEYPIHFKIQCSYVVEKCLLNNGINIPFKSL